MVAGFLLEGSLVDSAREQDPGKRRRSVELGARLPPATPVADRRVVRKLGLEDVAADRAEPAGGFDDDPPARLVSSSSRYGG